MTREARVTIPELALIAGTRVALGAGIALLLGDRLDRDERRVLGWALVILGVTSSIPLAFEVLGREGREAPAEWAEREVTPAHA